MEHNEELKDLNSKIEIDSKSPYTINNLIVKPAVAIILFSFYQNSNFVAINELSDLGYGLGILIPFYYLPKIIKLIINVR